MRWYALHHEVWGCLIRTPEANEKTMYYLGDAVRRFVCVPSIRPEFIYRVREPPNMHLRTWREKKLHDQFALRRNTSPRRNKVNASRRGLRRQQGNIIETCVGDGGISTRNMYIKVCAYACGAYLYPGTQKTDWPKGEKPPSRRLSIPA
jgi:hypothetical protein